MTPTTGQIAYESYAAARGGKSFDGKPLPPWPEVAPDIQAAWEQAALAVIGSLLTRDQLETIQLLRDPLRLRVVCRMLLEAHSVALSLQRLATGVPAPKKG